jgi:hypothetical protein
MSGVGGINFTWRCISWALVFVVVASRNKSYCFNDMICCFAGEYAHKQSIPMQSSGIKAGVTGHASSGCGYD